MQQLVYKDWRSFLWKNICISSLSMGLQNLFKQISISQILIYNQPQRFVKCFCWHLFSRYVFVVLLMVLCSLTLQYFSSVLHCIKQYSLPWHLSRWVALLVQHLDWRWEFSPTLSSINTSSLSHFFFKYLNHTSIWVETQFFNLVYSFVTSYVLSFIRVIELYYLASLLWCLTF